MVCTLALLCASPGALPVFTGAEIFPPEEFAAHLDGTTCPSPRDLVVPKVVDITDDGHVTYDERQRAKQPDWSYAEP